MTEQEQTARFVKAASTGFVHTLAQKGYPTEMLGKAAVLYAHPEDGLLRKRANTKSAVKEAALQRIMQNRAAKH